MISTKATKTKKEPYKPAYNIMSSISIKKEYEKDYEELLLYLKDHGLSKGSYLIECYRELDKPSWNDYLQTLHSN